MEDRTASLFDIHPLSTHDGPGVRTALFFKGCSLNCDWCQNPESINPKDQVWHHPLNCLGCGICIESCPEDALSRDTERGIKIDYGKCTGCGECAALCPGKALKRSGKTYTLHDALRIIKRDIPFMTKRAGGGDYRNRRGTSFGRPEYIERTFLQEGLNSVLKLQHKAVENPWGHRVAQWGGPLTKGGFPLQRGSFWYTTHIKAV